MIVSFPSVGDCMSRALTDLQTALELERNGSGQQKLRVMTFARAMSSLVGVQVGTARDGVQPTLEELADFRAEVAALVEANGRSLYSYLDRSLDYAIRSRVDGWYVPCLRRTATQLLLDDYPDAVEVLDTDNRELVEEIDEMFRDRAPDVAPLPKSAIPPGLPESHWWWNLPSGDPLEIAKREQLLDYSDPSL